MNAWVDVTSGVSLLAVGARSCAWCDRNPGAKTIDLDLSTALNGAGALLRCNMELLQKVRSLAVTVGVLAATLRGTGVAPLCWGRPQGGCH